MQFVKVSFPCFDYVPFIMEVGASIENIETMLVISLRAGVESQLIAFDSLSQKYSVESKQFEHLKDAIVFGASLLKYKPPTAFTEADFS